MLTPPLYPPPNDMTISTEYGSRNGPSQCAEAERTHKQMMARRQTVVLPPSPAHRHSVRPLSRCPIYHVPQAGQTTVASNPAAVAADATKESFLFLRGWRLCVASGMYGVHADGAVSEAGFGCFGVGCGKGRVIVVGLRF